VRARLSLRARLLLGVFILAAVALAAADVATYASLRSFLIDRVDSALEAGHVQVERTAFGQQGGGPGGGGPDQGGAGPPAQGIDWYEVRTRSGLVVRSGFLVGGGEAPRIPPEVEIPDVAPGPAGNRERVVYFTAPADEGSGSYRVRASIEPHHSGQILVVATSLHDAYATLNRLLLVEIFVTAAALAGIAGLGMWVIRLGLRPLREIEATAATIAAGDLSRRVRRDDPRTEVGRLGHSLNAMLAQIESAFRAREESEGRLRRSETRLRRFVADASHELRTPLAAIRAYAELFSRGAATRPEDLARSMSGITRESERMSLLVEDLLLLARLDEGRPLERRPVDLAGVVAEAVDAARAVDQDRPITVHVEHAPVEGDRDRLRQLVDNLLANARAHTPAGTSITVELSAGAADAELRVSDTGPGLTDEAAAQVFERFYRVDTSRARASGGVGLGLSIVAAVAEAHGGSAAAQPNPGGGATFIVTLPLAPPTAGGAA
jgi:two-component system, OmpR family, sensor kinase